ncbi:MAG: hypothetical protein ACREP6_00945 [Candidatus Binataceae bacterium]
MNKIGGGGERSGRKRKTDRRSFRLGGGEYERQAETRIVEAGEGPPARIAIGAEAPRSIAAARRLFFDAAAVVEPEFIKELNRATSAALKALGARTPGPDPRVALPGFRASKIEKLRLSDSPWLMVTRFPQYEGLRDALRALGRRFKLSDDWLFDLAIAELCPPPWEEDQIARGPYVATAKKLSLIPWQPELETRKEARARLYGAIERHLEAVEERADTEGLKRTRERRSRGHFLWLAGYQVRGWSQRRIAEAIGVDRAGVVRAINGLARAIGLSLRAASANDRGWTVERIATALRCADL